MSKMPLRFRMCAYVLEKLPNLTVFSEHCELTVFQRLSYCILRMRFTFVAPSGSSFLIAQFRILI
jgi:hypothetical protein